MTRLLKEYASIIVRLCWTESVLISEINPESKGTNFYQDRTIELLR